MAASDAAVEAIAKARVQRILRERLPAMAQQHLAYVLPLLNLSRASKPLVAGCAVKLAVAGRRLLLAAAHVIDELRAHTIHYVNGSGALTEVTGESCFTEPPPGGDRLTDRIDAGVILLDDDASSAVPGPYLSIKNLDINEADAPSKYCLVAGYPSNRLKKNFDSRRLGPRAMSFATTQVHDYSATDSAVQRHSHVVLDFERRAVVGESGQVESAPAPDGMSGCGVWAWRSMLDGRSTGRDRLIAVFTEHWEGNKVMIATRVAVHIHLIGQQWPALGAELPTPRNVTIRSRTAEQASD